MKHNVGTEKNWRRVRRMLACLLVGSSLSGCGGGSGSSQLVQNAIVSQNSTSVNSTSTTVQVSNTTRGCSATSFVPNFALETDPATNLPNQLYHWKAFPAYVYFTPSAYLTSERKAQTLAGFDWWGQAVGSAVRYEEVATAASANVVVKYETRGDTNYSAITEYHTNDKRQMLDATITFNMTYLQSIANITPVAAHEFGHALGIGGHSTDTKDVMSSSVEVYTRYMLSDRDTNTLKTAYCGLPDAISTPGSFTSGLSKSTGQSIVVRCGLGVH